MLRPFLILTFALVLLAAPRAMAAPFLARVAAAEDTLAFHLDGLGDTPCTIVELWPFETFDALDREPETVWSGGTPSIPRFDGKRDRMYMKYQLVARGKAAGHPQYVTDLSALPARDFPIPWYESKKGLTCPVDLDDFIELGTKYAVDNAPISRVIAVGEENPELWWEVDGEKVPINMPWVRSWCDARYKRMTDAGINITLVCTNLVGTAYDAKNPLHHPDTDYAHAPAHHGAINVTSPEGIRYFRAAMEFLADRYTRPDGKYGRISGIIVSNEVQSHWVWHNQGEATVEDVSRDYVVAMRIADLAARSRHKDLRIYASLEHHWTKRGYANNPLKEARGKEMLEIFADWCAKEGNFPWHLAFHPYPENLFEPRFWEDKIAPLRFDAPKITFKNLEVLPAFMATEKMLYNGKPRRIILSEQGFHMPDGPDGEQVQAAAYALAYHKVKHLDGIDAFMLHRHVSARDEGGLRLGLWTWDPDEPSGFQPGRKYYSWKVFQKADTPEWEQYFAFALPIIGLKSWDEALPATEIDTRPAPEVDQNRLVYDFHAHTADARRENTGDFRPVDVVRAAGWLAPGIFQHPPERGAGDALFEVALPAPKPDQALTLEFETMLQAESVNGVAFSVLVDGEEVFRRETKSQNGEPATVDLTPWAGKSVTITLRTDGLGDVGYDWAVWVQPLVMLGG